MTQNPDEGDASLESVTEYAVTNPRTATVVRTYATHTEEQITSAVDAAHAAFTQWGRTSSVHDRASAILRVATLHKERREELASAIHTEMGKSVEAALGEVDFSAAIYEFYADRAEEFLADETITPLAGEGTALIRRRPLGVLLGIMPWNYPAYQVARFAAPNLVAGNTIVLKHAPQCPRSAELLESIFVDAGLPAGSYVNIYADNKQVEHVIADPRVQGVSLTGSERAGAAVAEVAGRNLKKVVLELGGSDPFIVLGSDDLDATVEAAVAARMENAGHACNAAKRIVVHERLYEDFLARFTERILAVESAPLSSVAAAARLEGQVANAITEGAVFTGSGRRDGAHYPPGVLTDVSRDGTAYREEFFGPVAMVLKANSEAEAIEIANDTAYGLGSYVFTNDAAQAARVADQLDAGMVFVNGVGADGVELPFGGVKRSGFGRELGRFGIDEFVNKKLIRTLG